MEENFADFDDSPEDSYLGGDNDWPSDLAEEFDALKYDLGYN